MLWSITEQKYCVIGVRCPGYKTNEKQSMYLASHNEKLQFKGRRPSRMTCISPKYQILSLEASTYHTHFTSSH